MDKKRGLVLQHELDLPVGSFGDWARARGFELEVLPAFGGWAVPELSPYAFVCSLGSHVHSFDDDVPWLARELELLGAAHGMRIPTLGICFGAQVLARALGAPTGPAPSVEVGWIEIEIVNGAVVPPGPWLFWHEDRFDVPEDGELVGRTNVGPAAFRVDNSIGVQFHPEVNTSSLERMISSGGYRLAQGELDALWTGLAAEPDRFRERAWALYDGFLAAACDELQLKSRERP
jgi:GMP synthase-like glutamine amidotransferase